MHRFHKTQIVFLLLFGCITTIYQSSYPQARSNKIHVSFIGTKKNPAFISSINRDGITYAAVDELAQVLNFRTIYDNIKEKIEVVLPSTRLKFTAQNPFIVVVDHKTNSIAEVHQLPQEVIQTTNSYFVPVASFIPFFSRIWNHQITYNENNSSLTVSTKEGIEKKQISVEPPPTITTTPSTPAKKQFDISNISVESRKNGTLIRIHCKKNLNQFESTLANDGELIVKINGATADANELSQTPSAGEINKVTVAQAGDAAILRFALNTEVEATDITKDVATNDLLVSLYHKASVDSIYAAEVQTKKKAIDQKKARWKLDAIVIDAGHGGKDPGTIGMGGVKEKNIALGIALKLGKLISQKMKDVRVIYTRNSDKFIELDRRGQIANEETGKLFISIHCNSTEKKPSNAKGFEVYLLRPGRTDEAIRVAELENSVIKLEKDYEKRYTKLTNENFILINMAQSAYMKYSERFAEMLHNETKSEKFMKSNGVKQAGFLVLVGASMPSVLIETGFLSNTQEEKVLASTDGQQKIASMIFEAVQRYSKEYDKSLKE